MTKAGMRLHTIALGCQMSAADSEEMGAPLVKRGWRAAPVPEEADAVLISTCTVRQHAEDRAVSLIGSLRPWKEEDARRLLIVAGCAAERLGPWLQDRFPYIDLVVGSKSIEQYPALLEKALGGRFDAAAESAGAFAPGLRDRAFEPTGSPATGLLTIMRGCDYSCSYCIVPAVRGRELYRPAADILAEAAAKTSAGARELMLLGQTVNSYEGVHEGRKVDFAGLLRLIDAVPGLERLRFMSPHPSHFNDALSAVLRDCRTVCESVHLPAQSGSSRVLKSMRRGYTREAFLERARALRRDVPGVVLSTDIIVGFPTETEAEFEESLSLLEALRPAGCYSFKFSPRQSTHAASLPDDVPQDVKEERLARLNALVERLTREALNSQVGRTVSVLAEQDDFGRTRTGFKVRWETPVVPGTLVDIKTLSATRRTLLGEIDES